jgi:hypothetical protein
LIRPGDCVVATRTVSSWCPPRAVTPFVAGTHAFAHNGYFLPCTAIDDLIDPDLLAVTSGDTDSERYFLRIRTLLRDHDPATAIALATADIRARATFASLNCLLLTDDAPLRLQRGRPRRRHPQTPQPRLLPHALPPQRRPGRHRLERNTATRGNLAHPPLPPRPGNP